MSPPQLGRHPSGVSPGHVPVLRHPLRLRVHPHRLRVHPHRVRRHRDHVEGLPHLAPARPRRRRGPVPLRPPRAPVRARPPGRVPGLVRVPVAVAPDLVPQVVCLVHRVLGRARLGRATIPLPLPRAWAPSVAGPRALAALTPGAEAPPVGDAPRGEVMVHVRALHVPVVCRACRGRTRR